ncbi:MAG: mechanosensitive ion channel [Neofamilia sp.]
MSKIINKTIFAGQIANEMILFIMDIVLALGIIYLSSKVLKKLVNQALKRTHGDEKVINTLNKLLISVINVIFLVMVIFTLLEALGVNTASLVATAGIGGVAIGFGAQSLVKDIISGFFILLEGQYYVGEAVVISGISGTVVDFNLRTTKLRDYSTGAIHIIPNGTVNIVENRSRLDQLANLTLNIPIDYEPDEVLKILRDRLEQVQDERIVEGPKVMGISDWKERYYSIFISTSVINGEMFEM